MTIYDPRLFAHLHNRAMLCIYSWPAVWQSLSLLQSGQVSFTNSPTRAARLAGQGWAELVAATNWHDRVGQISGATPGWGRFGASFDGSAMLESIEKSSGRTSAVALIVRTDKHTETCGTQQSRPWQPVRHAQVTLHPPIHARKPVREERQVLPSAPPRHHSPRATRPSRPALAGDLSRAGD